MMSLKYFFESMTSSATYQVSVDSIEFDKTSGVLDPPLLSLVRRFVVDAQGLRHAVDTHDAPGVPDVAHVELVQWK